MTKNEEHSPNSHSTSDVDFRKGLLPLIPHLRAFSRALCGDPGTADDLAQTALAKAWEFRNRFEPGSNMKAWLFTILRNQFYSERRQAWRRVPWDDTKATRISGPREEQTWAVELSQTAQAFSRLPAEQREVLILIAVGGLGYEEAAQLTQCPVGTVKSRVGRARKALIAALSDHTVKEGRIHRKRSGAVHLLEQFDALMVARSVGRQQMAENAQQQ